MPSITFTGGTSGMNTIPDANVPSSEVNGKSKVGLGLNQASVILDKLRETLGGVDTSGLKITLELPMIGMEDIPLTEAMQQLETFGDTNINLQLEMGAFMNLLGGIKDVVDYLTGMSPETFEATKGQTAEIFDKIGQQADASSKSFFEMINSNKYPDFNSFLKEFLAIANELREMSGKARQASIEGQYQTVLLQAKELENVAEENYKAAMKNIDAMKKEAIGQIISGCLTIVTAVASFAIGKFAGVGTEMMQTIMATGNSVGQALSNITTGASSHEAAKDKTDAAEHEKKAKLSEAIIKKFEATLKLQQNSEQITNEMLDCAKALRDMILKMHQDFLSAQNQIIQRATI